MEINIENMKNDLCNINNNLSNRNSILENMIAAINDFINETQLKSLYYDASKENLKSVYLPILKGSIEVNQEIIITNNKVLGFFEEHVEPAYKIANNSMIELFGTRLVLDLLSLPSEQTVIWSRIANTLEADKIVLYEKLIRQIEKVGSSLYDFFFMINNSYEKAGELQFNVKQGLSLWENMTNSISSHDYINTVGSLAWTSEINSIWDDERNNLIEDGEAFSNTIASLIGGIRLQYQFNYRNIAEASTFNFPYELIEKQFRDGEDRAKDYGDGWQKASLSDAIEKFALGSKPVTLDSGKIVFKNSDLDLSVIYDPKGDYFKITDETMKNPPSKNNLEGSYNTKTNAYDLNGNKIPTNIQKLDDNGNIILNKKGLPIIHGRKPTEYRQASHYKNTDSEKPVQDGNDIISKDDFRKQCEINKLNRLNNSVENIIKPSEEDINIPEVEIPEIPFMW